MIEDEDGTPLLFTEEVAALAGVKVTTMRATATAANRKRRRGEATEYEMPVAARRVWRTVTKADGRPVVVMSPLYREDEIKAWLSRKRGPGGKPVRA